MKAFNCYYSGDRDLRAFIAANGIDSCESVLVQVFSGDNRPKFIQTLLGSLKTILPAAAILGTTSAGEILGGEYSQGRVVLSFLCLNEVRVKTALAPGDNADLFVAGQYLADQLVEEETGAMLVFSQGNIGDRFDPFRFVEGISDIAPNIPLAGGAASGISSGMGSYTTDHGVQTLVFTENGISENMAVGCAFNGAALRVTNDYNLGWKTVGKKMVITRAEIENSFTRVYEIDHVPARQIYRKYFGDQVADNLPASALSYSFVIRKNGMEIDSTPVNLYEDDSIVYSGKLPEGQVVQFGLGDADIILDDSRQAAERLARRRPEALFVYTCATRPLLLSHVTKNELSPYGNIAPVCGFFTNSEYYHHNGTHHTLGKTMTLLGLSEKPASTLEDQSNLSNQKPIEIVPALADEKKLNSLLAMTTMLQRMTDELESEHQRSEELLLNILPASVAEQLKKGQQNIADKIDDVTILFADLVGFTKLAASETPENLVSILNQMFSEFDRLAGEFQLEKIKTIGDAYFVAGGVPLPVENHTEKTLRFAMEMRKALVEFRQRHHYNLELRIGIHCGPVMAGVLGTKKFTYDLWGDTVNTASRMESHGVPGRVHVSEPVYERLKDKFRFDPPRSLEVKGKGRMKTWLLA